jgi:O-antigen ligase
MSASRRNWMSGLTGVLAALYAYVGISSQSAVMVAGLVGAVLIVVALVDLALGRWVREALIVIGALPLAAVTWVEPRDADPRRARHRDRLGSGSQRSAVP